MTVDKAKDLDLWRTWKRTRSSMDLEALMKQVKPLLDSAVGKWASIAPRFVLDNEAKKIALTTFETFDEHRGIQLSTFLTSNLQKLSRIAYERQSTLKVPEEHRTTYNQYTKARAELEDLHGHAPSMDRIADHMQIPAHRLETILRNVERRELMESGEGPSFQQEDDDSEQIEFAYHQMTPRQKQIFDQRTGSHGSKEAPDDQAIMKKVGITQGVLSYELAKIKSLLQQAQQRKHHS